MGSEQASEQEAVDQQRERLESFLSGRFIGDANAELARLSEAVTRLSAEKERAYTALREIVRHVYEEPMSEDYITGVAKAVLADIREGGAG